MPALKKEAGEKPARARRCVGENALNATGELGRQRETAPEPEDLPFISYRSHEGLAIEVKPLEGFILVPLALPQ